MITDSITLLDDSQIQRVRGDGQKGDAFPASPNPGDSWELTATDQGKEPGLYVYSELGTWVSIVDVDQDPYDIALSGFGRPRITDVFIRFAVPRTIMIEDLAKGVAYVGVAPTEDFVFKVVVEDPETENTVQLGTITFLAGSKSANIVSESGPMLIEKGQVLLLGVLSEFPDETLSDFTATLVSRYYR